MLYIQRQTEASRYREQKMFQFSSRKRFHASGICTDCFRNIIVFLMRTVNIGIECSEFEMEDNKKMLSRREVHHQHGYPYSVLFIMISNLGANT